MQPTANSRPADPYDPRLRDPFDHQAWFSDQVVAPCCDEHEFGPALSDPLIAPVWGPGADYDTGLRCFCGREIVSTLSDDAGIAEGTGWAHVGVGDAADPAGWDEWEYA